MRSLAQLRSMSDSAKTCAFHLKQLLCIQTTNTHNMLRKTSCTIPVPMISKPVVNNDYRPVALTSNVMKFLERVVRFLIRISSHTSRIEVLTMLSSLCYIMCTNTLISHEHQLDCYWQIFFPVRSTRYNLI